MELERSTSLTLNRQLRSYGRGITSEPELYSGLSCRIKLNIANGPVTVDQGCELTIYIYESLSVTSIWYTPGFALDMSDGSVPI